MLKLLTKDCTTRYHPSTRTKSNSLNGIDITTGGIIIIPNDIREDATIKSTIIKGMKVATIEVKARSQVIGSYNSPILGKITPYPILSRQVRKVNT